ncbi:UDP-glucose dehydrogenase family protein [Paenibacillus hamazuiensis]|uniref:UDP-glucose dehydrogenase family protein n=1 Tax=Paenibacillus hamazuiensis TaxID=2936508 RepID=UPI00200F4565|nr:nucleotide sugar dehydrogenase [Paenibacillus hamazuiensis]
MTNVAIIGLGFVGLTTGLGLAHKLGCSVYAYEADAAKRELYRKGIVPFHEPHLAEHLALYGGSRFVLCETLADAVQPADYIFYCVGTPSGPDGATDLSDLIAAVRACLEQLSPDRFRVHAIKSTVPPGTTAGFIGPMIERSGFRLGETAGLVNNPEFLREGSAWRDFIEADRIVIGEADAEGGRRTAELYASGFDVPIHRVSAATGEFVKYGSNALLATLISFSNEMAMIAEKTGDIDVPEVFRLLHEDKRWSGRPAKMTEYVFPGCGFGGYCLPKDTAALVHHASQVGYRGSLLREVFAVNDAIKRNIVERIAAVCRPAETVGILGLSFKPESDDVRGAVSREIIELLLERGFTRIVAYDPLAMEPFRKAYALPIEYAASMEELAQRADAIALVTAWSEFKRHQQLLAGKKVVDGRYFLDTGEVSRDDREFAYSRYFGESAETGEGGARTARSG